MENSKEKAYVFEWGDYKIECDPYAQGIDPEICGIPGRMIALYERQGDEWVKLTRVKKFSFVVEAPGEAHVIVERR